MMSWARATQSLYIASLSQSICLSKVQAIGKKATRQPLSTKFFSRDSPAEFSEPVELEEGVELKVVLYNFF